MKQILFLLILCLSGVAAPHRAAAWFTAPRNSPMPPYDSSRKITALDPYFVMFDDPLSGSSPGKDFSLLSGDTGNFAAIIRIDARIPLKVLSKRYMSPTESLDALLYADLQMRQLMEEISQLRIRSHMILKDLSIPYLEKKLLKNPSNTPSLKDETLILKQKKQALTGITDHNLKSDKFLSYKSNSPFKKIPGHPDVIKKTVVQGMEDPSGLTSRNGYVNTPYKADELPWLFQVFVGFFRYTLANRFETLFYAAILFMFFYFVSLKIKAIQ